MFGVLKMINNNGMTMSYNRTNLARTRAGQANRVNKRQADAIRAMLKWGFAIGFAVILFCGVLMVMTEASSEKPALPTAGESLVYVGPGDTLWNIASTASGQDEDVRRKVFEIKKRNNLDSDVLLSGQTLIIPE